MVQFGQYLQSFRYSDWSEHYLDYEGLKRIIYSQNPQLNDLSSGDQVEVKKNELKLKVKKSKRTLLRGSDEIIRESTEFQEQRRRLSHLSESAKHNKNYQEFLKKLDENLLKINSFYETKKAFLNERLQSVENSLNTKIIKKSQVKRSLEEIFIELVLLKDFASLNYTGFTKLLKKHDKILWDIVPPLRAHYIKDKCNQQPVFGILDEVFSLQLETQFLYADLYHDGNRIDAEIALGASILERIGETKQKRLAPKSVYLGYDVDSLEQSVVSADQPTLPRFSITDASWMRARIAMQSISGSDYSGFVSLLLSFLLIFIGGCGQTFFLEYMIYVEPHAGQTITFFQFLAIALAGVSKFVDRDPKESILRFWKKFHLVKRKIAFKYHALLVFLSWMGAYTSAKAYNFNISVSLHMVFKSGILLINMLLGACILHKRYNHKQVLSVLLVTFGVLMTTAASLPSSQKSASGESDILNWFVGLSILIVSLVTTGFLGIFQDMAYDKFGKHWEEVLFYVHLLGVPLYLLEYEKILSDLYTWTTSRPEMWFALISNSFLSFVGVRGIYNLTGLTTSLTTSLTITVRKFLSLIISAYFFKSSAFDQYQWTGAVFVLIGSTLYTYASTNRRHPTNHENGIVKSKRE